MQVALAVIALTFIQFPVAYAQLRTHDELAQQAHAYMNAWLETGRFTGTVLIARQGEVLFNRGYGRSTLNGGAGGNNGGDNGVDNGGDNGVDNGVDNEVRTPFRIGSLSKQFTAAAILRLHQDGLVELDAPLVRYLPELGLDQKITVHHLLSHASGLADYTALPDYPQLMATETDLDELSRRIAGILPLFPPGTAFHYSNSNYVLLAAVVQEVTGREFDTYLAETFFIPLRMCGTWGGGAAATRESAVCQDVSELSPANGYIFTGDDYVRSSPIHLSQTTGAGGVTSTTVDLLTWIQALSSVEVLTAESLDMLFGRHIAVVPSSSGSPSHYGYGWFRSRWNGGRELISHGGGVNGFSSQLMVFPDQELVVVVLGNVDGAPARAVADGLAAITLEEPYTVPRVRESVELATESIEALAGRYATGPGPQVEVVAQSGRLYLAGPGDLRFRLFPASPNLFFLRNADVELLFVTGDSGEVLGLVMQRGGVRIPGRRLD